VDGQSNSWVNQKALSLARKEERRLFDSAEAATSQLIDVSPALRLSLKRGQAAANFQYLNIYGPNGLIERVEYHETYTNTAARDRLGICLCRYTDQHEAANKPATKLMDREFAPFITLEDKVLWKMNEGLYDSVKLIESAHTEFIDQVEREPKGR